MNANVVLAKAAALIGDRSRAAMLWSLQGGESRPASELAMLANISPQTASNHLRLLVDAEFLSVISLGRNKFYRLADASVAMALESLVATAHGKEPFDGIAHQTAPDLVFARTCYDHLAGELAVAILSQLQRRDYLFEDRKDLRPTLAGDSFFRDLGIDVTGLSVKRRRFAFPCLDWSHRVPHLGGALGAALLDWLLQSKVIVRRKGSRAVRMTEGGYLKLDQVFSLRVTQASKVIACG
jgi:DNA-binding transcriptional ArsR family regulator